MVWVFSTHTPQVTTVLMKLGGMVGSTQPPGSPVQTSSIVYVAGQSEVGQAAHALYNHTLVKVSVTVVATAPATGGAGGAVGSQASNSLEVSCPRLEVTDVRLHVSQGMWTTYDMMPGCSVRKHN